MALNGNNILRFSGVFDPAPFFFSEGSVDVTLFSTEESVVCNPLTGVSASLGIDTYSFEITGIFKDDRITPCPLVKECEWDGVSALTIFRPADLSVSNMYIKFEFSDVMGNKATNPPYECYVHVIVSAISTVWVPYVPSAVCTLDLFGNNTGYLGWSQLALQNSSTSVLISPLQLKDNVPSDLDYIAPQSNLSACPLATGGGANAPLTISNFTKSSIDPNNYITITNLYLYSATGGSGGSPIALNIPCNIIQSTSRIFNIPSGIAWDVTLSYSVTGTMELITPLRQWYQNLNGVVSGFPTTPQFIDNSGILTGGSVNLPLTVGIIIFAQ